MKGRVWATWFVAWCSLFAARGAEGPPLVLISLDGFRWNYCAQHPAETAHLRALAREGVAARGLIPVFPSNTFPNHYAIVTGLYPSHHGIINNVMFDPQLGEFFRYITPASSRDGRWWNGEPIWVTAEKQGLRSACYFWPGSEALIENTRPTHFKPFNKSTSFDDRLEETIGWLKLPEGRRPRMVTFYIEDTNGAGHLSGPESAGITAAVKRVDAEVGEFASRLKREGIIANLVVVSDHGMTACDDHRVVFLDDYLEMAQVQVDFEQTVVGLRPTGGQDVAGLLRALAQLPPQAKAYRAEDLPARYHIDARNPRVPPVWILPMEGWQVMRRSLFNVLQAKFDRGQHGYDPGLASMRGIFIANGPAFKSGVELEPFENVHLYNFLCATLGLTPAPNDGDDRLVKSALRD
jgi:predicted AlkP superfamily pyrophosphatase or phosphodiesterase